MFLVASTIPKMSYSESSVVKEIFCRGIENSAKALHYFLNTEVKVLKTEILTGNFLPFDKLGTSSKTVVKASIQGDIPAQCYCIVDDSVICTIGKKRIVNTPEFRHHKDQFIPVLLKTFRYLVDTSTKFYASMFNFYMTGSETEQLSLAEAFDDFYEHTPALVFKSTIQISSELEFDVVWGFGSEFLQEIEYYTTE